MRVADPPKRDDGRCVDENTQQLQGSRETLTPQSASFAALVDLFFFGGAGAAAGAASAGFAGAAAAGFGCSSKLFMAASSSSNSSKMERRLMTLKTSRI